MSKNVNEGYRLAHTMIRVKDLEKLELLINLSKSVFNFCSI